MAQGAAWSILIFLVGPPLSGWAMGQRANPLRLQQTNVMHRKPAILCFQNLSGGTDWGTESVELMLVFQGREMLTHRRLNHYSPIIDHRM